MESRLAIVLAFGASLIAAIFGTLFFTSAKAGGASQENLSAAIDTYIVENPTKIVDAFKKARDQEVANEQQKAEATIKEKRDELENADSSPVIGNPDGDVTVVKFSDYNCGYCKRAGLSVNEAIAKDKNIRVVLKDFPILGPSSELNSKAAVAVYNLDPTKYIKFHEALLKKGAPTEAKLLALAESVGIDKNTLKAEMAKDKYREILARNLVLGQSIGVQGTPAFVIGGKFVRGAIGAEQILQEVAAVRAKK